MCVWTPKDIYQGHQVGNCYCPLCSKSRASPVGAQSLLVFLVKSLSQTRSHTVRAAAGNKFNQPQRAEPFSRHRSCSLWPCRQGPLIRLLSGGNRGISGCWVRDTISSIYNILFFQSLHPWWSRSFNPPPYNEASCQPLPALRPRPHWTRLYNLLEIPVLKL